MKNIFLILSMCLFINCDDTNEEQLTDCSTVLCKNPSFFLELIESESQKNVFLENIYNAQDVVVLDISKDYPLNFSYYDGSLKSSDQYGKLRVNLFLENQNLKIILPDDDRTEFLLSFEFTKEDLDVCCPNYILSNPNIDDFEFKFDGDDTITVFL